MDGAEALARLEIVMYSTTILSTRFQQHLDTFSVTRQDARSVPYWTAFVAIKSGTAGGRQAVATDAAAPRS